MRRALRISAWTVGALLLVIVALSAVVLIGGNTTEGRALIERLVNRLSAGEVRVSGLGGSFPAAIDLARVEFSDERGGWLTAERISLRWSPLALLAWHVRAESLRVARLDFKRLPVTHPSSSRSGVTLPRIDIGSASLEVLELAPALA